VLEHKKEVLDQHLKEKLVYYYLELRDKHFGFNESFIIWVKTLYSNIQTCVMNNGWISEIFKNSREIRQGLPKISISFIATDISFLE
jgi:hypothetical protein